jgi:predicted RNA-binding protein with PUA-like domain
MEVRTSLAILAGGVDSTRMATNPKFWLVKTEPDSFSIDDLAAASNQTTCWAGVRNYQARNFMREMKLGERVLFYHSGGDAPAVVGTARVLREAYPDHTSWDKKDPHYDPKSTPENPRWFMIDLRFDEKFKRPLSLDELRDVAALAKMELLRRGSRLSIQPVSKSEFDTILKLAKAPRR